MNYLTLGIHYPKPEHVEDIVAKIKEISGLVRQQDGLIDAGAFTDEANMRIILMSLWESEEHGKAASPVLRPVIQQTPWEEWERQPSDNMAQLQRLV